MCKFLSLYNTISNFRMSTKPIRVGLIGLTARPNIYDWAGTVHLAYYKKSPLYKLVAVSNSSIGAAHAAIKKYELDSSVVKAYGSPQDLADDPDIDLSVVVVRTSKHKELIMPSLMKGKSAFVEWPLGRTLEEAEEMAEAAQKSGSKTIVGLQAEQAPIFKKIKELIRNDTVGKILSTTVTGALLVSGAVEDKSTSYAMDINSGSTIVDVQFAHCELDP
jgi:predicted dehydrogenase